MSRLAPTYPAGQEDKEMGEKATPNRADTTRNDTRCTRHGDGYPPKPEPLKPERKQSKRVVRGP